MVTMYDLMKFFDGNSVERLARNLRAISREFERNYFDTPHTLFNTTSFVKEDGKYKVEFDVAKDANAKNVSVDLEDGVLSVSYSYKEKNFESSFEWSETMPKDSDQDSLEAVVENGKLIITTDILEAKENDRCNGDNTRITINRK